MNRKHFSYIGTIIASITALISLLVSMQTPVEASASMIDEQSNENNASTTDSPKVIESSIIKQGTGTFKYTPEIERESGTCRGRILPWIKIENNETGEIWWDGIRNSIYTLTFDTGISYPGGSLTVTVYEKPEISTDGSCDFDYEPNIPESELEIRYVEHITIGWEKPEILDVFEGEYNDRSAIGIRLNQGWLDEFSSGSYLNYRNGLVFYNIDNYGSRNNETFTLSYSLCRISGDACYISTYNSSNRGLGIAVLPESFDRNSVDNWPIEGAISDHIIASDNPILENDSTIEQAGPNDSTPCVRICAGDPIDTYTGNFFETTTDLEIPGRIGIGLERNYAVGLLDETGAFGSGWVMNYDMRIETNENGRRIDVVEPSGNRSPFIRQNGDHIIRANASLEADLSVIDNGWEFSRWGEELTYVFDDSGLLKQIRDNNDNTVEIQHDAGNVSRVVEGERFIELSWDEDRLTKIQDHTGREVLYNYTDGQLVNVSDVSDNDKSYSYDSVGRVDQMVFPDGGVTSNVYDDQDRVLKQKLPDGQVLEFNWNPSTRVHLEIESGDSLEEYRYSSTGRLTSFTDSADDTASITRTYDSMGRIRTEQSFDEYRQDLEYEHDIAGNLIEINETRSGSTERFEYDDRRVSAYIDKSGIRTEFVRDDKGNIIETRVIPTDGSGARVTSADFNGNGDQISETNALGERTTMTYSNAGDILSITDPVGDTTTFNVDEIGRVSENVVAGGNVDDISTSERELFSTSYEYDAADNVVVVNTPDGEINYTYDTMNRPTSMVDVHGGTGTVEYDEVGRRTVITYPDGSMDEFEYDVDTGRLIAWTDPQGLTTEYEYTAGSTTTISPDGSKETVSISIRASNTRISLRDDSSSSSQQVSSRTGNQLTQHLGNRESNVEYYDGAGQITQTVANGVTTDYSYNGFGELISESAPNREVGYEYDEAGQLVGINYPDGTVVEYEHDAAGRIADIIAPSGTEYAFSYAPSGMLDSMKSSTDFSYETSFDGLRATSKTWSQNGEQIAKFGQEYGSSGLVVGDSSFTGERDFTWNESGQLASVDQHEVTWDGRLLTSFDNKSLTYDETNSRLVTDGQREFAYDVRGNRISDGNNEYSWNLQGQLTNLGDDSYTYDTFGLRSSINGQQQVYGQDSKLLSDGEFNYVRGPDGSLLEQVSLDSGKSQQMLTDNRGTVHAVTDIDGEIIAEYGYSVFGERELVGGEDVTIFGYVGEQHDTTGLIYLRMRYYDPSVGQFISVDPMVTTTLDPYGYASGNPLQLIDPLGLFSWRDAGNFMLEHSSAISAGLSVAAVVTTATGFGAPVGIGLAAAASGLSVLSGVNNFRQGNIASGSVDFVAAMPGFGSLGARAFERGVRYGTIKGGATTRREIRDTVRPYERFRDRSDNISATLLVGSGASGGVNKLC